MFYLAREILTFGTPFILIIVLWIRWRRKQLKLFEDLGIPGPPPHFLFGNILEINKKGLLQCQTEWIQKYGQNVGYYHGLKPVLMITDKGILKRIFIKDFHLFSDRPEVVPLRVHSFLDSIIPATKIMDSLLLNKKGEEWKRARSRLSPIFSANKLKMMIPFVEKVTDVTISILEETASRQASIDVYHLLQCLTLDIISAEAFAVHTNAQREGTNNSLFRSAKTIFDNPLTSKVLTIGLCFPEVSILGMALNFLKMFYVNGFSIPPLKITNLVGKVIEQRRKHPHTRQPDLLQFLIDASEPDSDDSDKHKQQKDSDSENTLRKTPIQNEHTEKSEVKHCFTDIEIKANSLVVFLAGQNRTVFTNTRSFHILQRLNCIFNLECYSDLFLNIRLYERYETTSSALAFIIHMLAKYPEYQVEIQKEIDRCVTSHELTYCILNNLQFMDSFMRETMRFYPPGEPFVLRVATSDVDFGYLRIPKGMEITVPVNYMHFNENNWQNPEIFDPDRFLMEKRNPERSMNYWAFGIGPRNCLGARLANITSKVVLIKLLQRFTFHLPDNSKDAAMTVSVKAGTMVPDKVIVIVKEREINAL